MNRIKIKMVVAMAGLGIATIGQPAMAVSVIGEVLRGSGTAAIAVAGVAAADSSAYDSMILHSSFHISSWRIGGTTAAGNALDPVAPGTAANAAVAPGRADRSDPSPRIEAQYRTEASAGTAARGGIAASAGTAGPAEGKTRHDRGVLSEIVYPSGGVELRSLDRGQGRDGL